MMYILYTYVGNDLVIVGRFGYEACLHNALMAMWLVGNEFHCMGVM